MHELVIFLVAVAVGGALGVAILRFGAPLVLGRAAAEPTPGKPARPARDSSVRASAPRAAPRPAKAPPAAVVEPAMQAETAAASEATECEPVPAPEEGGRERRKHPRLVSEAPILVTPFAGRETLGEVCDVSLGGVRFRVVGLALRAGDILRVTFNLGEESLAAVARVLRTQQLDEITTEVSAEFARLDPWAARRFEEALAERS